MPIIRVSCLPKVAEGGLRRIYRQLILAVESIEELKLKGKPINVTVLFPTDMMAYGLGEEIIIEVVGLFIKPERTKKIRNRLAERLGRVIHEEFPKAMVECLIFSFDPAEGFWSSERLPTLRCRFFSNGGPKPVWTEVFDTKEKPYEKEDNLPTWPLVVTLEAKTVRLLYDKIKEAEGKLSIGEMEASRWGTKSFPNAGLFSRDKGDL